MEYEVETVLMPLVLPARYSATLMRPSWKPPAEKRKEGLGEVKEPIAWVSRADSRLLAPPLLLPPVLMTWKGLMSLVGSKSFL